MSKRRHDDMTPGSSVQATEKRGRVDAGMAAECTDAEDEYLREVDASGHSQFDCLSIWKQDMYRSKVQQKDEASASDMSVSVE